MANEETFNLALEALQDPLSPTKRLNAITALLKTIAEEDKQEQGEPVTFEEWLSKQHGDPEEIGFLQALRIAYISGQDSITTPQQRTWVGLTDEETNALWMEGEANINFENFSVVAYEIEVKLRIKNA